MQLTSDVFMWNEKFEVLPRKELEELQLSRLKSVITQLIASVPFYKNKLGQLNLSADSLSRLTDLPKFPFTTKSDLRDEYPSGFNAVDKSRVARLHCSSGTRGKPTVAAYTKADLAMWAEVCARSLACAGVRPGDVLHNSYGYGLFTGGIGIHQGAELLGATVVPASGGRTQQQLMLMNDFAARVLCCTPSYALNIAGAYQQGTDDWQLNLEIGILGAEPWSEQCRKQIEAALGIKAMDIYGLSEIIGPGVAMECIKEQNGLHIWEDHFLPEIIDPQTLEPVAEGAEGELVITTLTKQALPLLRYRTGDICSLITEPCSCGRTMHRISRIKGRIDDMLIIRGVNIYPSEIESIVYDNENCGSNYQIVISREQALDTVSLRCEIKEDLYHSWQKHGDDAPHMREVTEALARVLRDKLGITIMVDMVVPNSLASSEGKAMRVLDLRGDNR